MVSHKKSDAFIRNNPRFTEEQKYFFLQLSTYLNHPLYFYGSITRFDYIPGKSDIDVLIFTNNELSLLNQLGNYFNVSQKHMKPFIYKIRAKIFTGYKYRYSNKEKGIDTEITIFNSAHKKDIITDYEKEKHMPFYIFFILYVIKLLYYHFGVLSTTTYKHCKRFLMNENAELKMVDLTIPTN